MLLFANMHNASGAKCPLLPEAGQATAPCLPMLGYANPHLWLPSVIIAMHCAEKSNR